MDELIHGTAAGETVRFMAAITTEIVTEAVRRHDTSPTVAAAFGRVLTGTLLLGTTLKEFDRLSVKIEAEGAVGGIVAETTKDGTVRGYVRNPKAEIPPKANGKFDVGGIIGGGMFYVIRESGFDVGLHREPYIGSVPIVSGEIGEDFAYYLAKSEQIPSAVLLGVFLQNEEPFVKSSGGVIIQMLPGAGESTVAAIEQNFINSPHLTDIINQGADAEKLLQTVLGEIDYEILERKEVSFACNCSFDRAVLLISSLGADEIRSMLEEDKGAKMTCGFCNEEYDLDEADLKKMLEQPE